MTEKEKRKASEPWIRIPTDEIAIEKGYYFDQDAADRVCGFFPRFLKHSTGNKFSGVQFDLSPWQTEALSRAYGWMRPNGFRRFSEVFLEVPKKNGKSTMLSGVALFGLCEEPGAEVYAGAVNKNQARIVFREAQRMVAKSPDLRKNFKVIDSIKMITFPGTSSFFEAMSADVESKDGLNMSTGILDEIHRFRDSKMYDVMKYAGSARDQAILWMITTAGDSPYSFWGKQRKRAEMVLDGTNSDLHFLPILYAANKEVDNLDDPAVWRRVNPGLGTILSEDKFKEEYDEAKKTPTDKAKFERLRLGIPQDKAMKWLNLKDWNKYERVYDLKFFKGRYCYAALDVSTNIDLTAIALCTKIGDLVYFYLITFIPEDTAEHRSETDKVPYPEWVDDGWMIQTDGNTTDYKVIRSIMNDMVAMGITLYKVGMDPWNAQELCNNLIEDGHEVLTIRQVHATLHGPSKEFERILLNGTIRHDGNPILHWCLGNTSVKFDSSGNIKPDKDKSTDRIDGAVAAIMALGLMMNYPDVGPPTVTQVG